MSKPSYRHPSHHAPSGGFQNPWPSANGILPSVSAILRIPVSRATPFDTDLQAVKCVRADFGLYEGTDSQRDDGIVTTWLGHAGFLVQLPTKPKPTRIIFDPILTQRASPVSWFGPKRYIPTPCSPKDIPSVDYIAISHNHYDHLSIPDLREIHARSPNARFLVPLGVKTLLAEELGIDRGLICEMDWWESGRWPVVWDADGAGEADGEGRERIEFVCTPAQHNSGRNINDQSKTLWASWVVRHLPPNDSLPPISSVYFAGDTGYTTSTGPCPAFAEIGDKYGPFDLAMVPIWRGASLSVLGKLGLRLTATATHTLLSTLHASPSDAVHLARDVKARRVLAMHFGTFVGSEDEAREPLVILEGALKGEKEWKGGSQGEPLVFRGKGKWVGEGFGAIDVGETVVVPLTR